MKEEVSKWLKLAKDDLKSAKVNFKSKQYYVCSFLCQQSAEKALKALLIKKIGKLIKIHDLIVLGNKVDLPENLSKKCDKLNSVYLDARYGDLGGKLPSKKFNKKISLEFLNTAKELLKWVEKSI
jgi:HEPN domain-containing protein